VSLSKLPVCGGQFVGREQELAALDRAWGDGTKNVLSLVAWGGTGKTALVLHWLARLAQDGYRGAQRVFGWSFSSQGTTDRVVSADEFIASALTWFGDRHPEQGSPWDKGLRLAGLVRSQKTLLILDGVEPHQQSLGSGEGQLKDPALQTFVRELAAQNLGLCILSTRLPVADLVEYQPTTAPRLDLEGVAPGYGRLILRGFDVQGSDGELEAASEEFRGHCLALNLLGSYLQEVCQGDIRRRSEIGPLQGDERNGGQARRVMRSYERWLGPGPALAVLRLLGLFDRPADEGEVEVLRRAPVLCGLTDGLFLRRSYLARLFRQTPESIPEHEWERALAKLRRARLLADADPSRPKSLDTHPLVRDYFGEQIRGRSPRAWRQGHARLYLHHLGLASALPSTLVEMAPLYAAVRHGCEAGRHDDALTVYQARIQRGDKHRYSMHQLGAYGSDLAALSTFFRPPWVRPVKNLSPQNKAYVLGQAARCLKALGRLGDAVQVQKESLAIAITNKDWRFAAGRAGNLSQLYLVMGNLSEALAFGKQGVELADRSGDLEQRVSRRSNLGDASHHHGDLDQARSLFQEAEGLQQQFQPTRPLLHSIEGFRYCDLLLTVGDHREVLSRGQQFFAWRTDADSLLNVALDHLVLGRAHLLRDQTEGLAKHTEASTHLEESLDRMRRAGTAHHLPRALLARAELRRTQGAFPGARQDITEALAIAQRNGMRLYQADCHFEYARLQLSLKENDAATSSLATFCREAVEIGCRRREGEVEDLERLLKSSSPEAPA
jgi:tetratricopeptide (TPR) repeat protein